MAKRSRTKRSTPYNGFALMWQTTRLALEAQTVIALRLAKLASGGPAAQTETTLMITEKLRALGESQAIALRSIGTPDGGAARITALYQRKVRANRTRLSNNK